MAARGPQNGRWGLERGLPHKFLGTPVNFRKIDFFIRAFLLWEKVTSDEENVVPVNRLERRPLMYWIRYLSRIWKNPKLYKDPINIYIFFMRQTWCLQGLTLRTYATNDLCCFGSFCPSWPEVCQNHSRNEWIKNLLFYISNEWSINAKTQISNFIFSQDSKLRVNLSNLIWRGHSLIACNAVPPAKYKMAARVPQNGRRGLERFLPLGFCAF